MCKCGLCSNYSTWLLGSATVVSVRVAVGVSWVFPRQRQVEPMINFPIFFQFFLRMIWQNKDIIGVVPFHCLQQSHASLFLSQNTYFECEIPRTILKHFDLTVLPTHHFSSLAWILAGTQGGIKEHRLKGGRHITNCTTNAQLRFEGRSGSLRAHQ